MSQENPYYYPHSHPINKEPLITFLEGSHHIRDDIRTQYADNGDPNDGGFTIFERKNENSIFILRWSTKFSRRVEPPSSSFMMRAVKTFCGTCAEFTRCQPKQVVETGFMKGSNLHLYGESAGSNDCVLYMDGMLVRYVLSVYA